MAEQAAQLAALQAMVAELGNTVRAQQQTIVNLEARASQQQSVEQVVGTLVSSVREMVTQQGTTQTRSSTEPDGGRFDLRQLGKPELFYNDGKVTWRDWSIVFRAFAIASRTNMKGVLEWGEVASEDTEALNAAMSDSQRSLSQELYYMLTMLVRGAVLDIVCNAGVGEGCLAWRHLVWRFEPKTKLRYASTLISLLGFDFSGDVQVRLEAFDREVATVERLSGEKVPDSIKVGLCIRSMEDTRLKEHLVLKAEKLQQWAQFKDEVTAIRRVQVATSASPMEIGAFQHHNKKSRKGGGKGDAEDRKCFFCGKPGHLAKDCRKKQSADAQGSAGTSQSSGHRADKGKEKSDVKCYKCHKRGHIAKDCKAKVHSVAKEEEDHTPTEAYESEPEECGGLFINNLEICALSVDQVQTEANLSHSQVRELLKLGVLREPEDEPENTKILAPLSQPSEGKAVKVTFGVDSCAAITGIPSELAPEYPTYVDKHTGRNYKAASGHPIKDEGLKLLVGALGGKRGPRKALKTRVCKIQRPLLAVGEVCESGSGVFFSKSGSCIVDEKVVAEIEKTIKKTKRDVVPVARRNGVFEVEMTIERYNPQFQNKLAAKQGFRRAARETPQ